MESKHGRYDIALIYVTEYKWDKKEWQYETAFAFLYGNKRPEHTNDQTSEDAGIHIYTHRRSDTSVYVESINRGGAQFNPQMNAYVCISEN